jgi:hypothetical protein
MRRGIAWAALALAGSAGLVAPGCGDGRGHVDKVRHQIENDAKALDRQTREAVESVRDYMRGDGRDGARRGMEDELRALGERIQDIALDINRLNRQTKPDLQEAVVNLQAKSAALVETLHGVRNADARTWTDRIKPRVKQALGELVKAYEEVLDKLD